MVRLSEVPINFLESNYDAQVVQPMRVKRGCHAIAHVEGRVYVFGGQNHVDKLLKKCERYSVADDTWENIAQMYFKRKNCSACALSQHKIYVFGGTEHSSGGADSIECYDAELDAWDLVPIRLPCFMTMQVAYKVTQRCILLLGGVLQEADDEIGGVSSRVYRFNPESMRISLEADLPQDLVSLYPAAMDSNKLYIVNENVKSDCPEIVQYELTNFLPGGPLF